MKNKEKAKMASGVNILLAIWLLASPFVLGFSGTAMATNFFIAGILAGVVAITRVFSVETSSWLSWVNIALGIWLILSPFLFLSGFSEMITWNSIISGVLLAGLASWSSFSSMSTLTTR